MIDYSHLLTFKLIFPDRELPFLTDLLSKVRKDELLEITNHYCENKLRDHKPMNAKTLCFEYFFSSGNQEYANEIYNKIAEIESKNGKHFELINVVSALMAFSEAFKLPETDIPKMSNGDLEKNMFDVFTTINHIMIFGGSKSVYLTEPTPRKLIKSAEYIIDNLYASDLVNVDLDNAFKTQTVKAILFFQFLESDKRFSTLLNGFLSFYESPNWREYIKFYLPLPIATLMADNEGKIEVGIPDASKVFIDKMIMEPGSTWDEYDFRQLRTAPFYKINDNTCRISFSLFVIQKIYTGLYFMLNAVNNKVLKKKDRVSALWTKISGDFSERYLLYKLLENINDGKNVYINGDQLMDLVTSGATDSYVRNKHMVMLFESKDVLLNEIAKHNRNFPELEAILKEKFYVLNSGELKAVKQLVNNIEFVLRKKFADTDYDVLEIDIYCMIVIHNPMFNCLGLNTLIQSWFDEELNRLREMKDINVSRVKPVIVLDIDTLILYEDYFKQDKDLIFSLANQYIAKVSEQDNMVEALKGDENGLDNYYCEMQIPFSHFVDAYFTKILPNKAMPERVTSMGKDIFPEAYINTMQSEKQIYI